MTSLVFYFYESNELSTNEHTTSAFQLQLSWTMTIIVVTAYVLMIAANGNLLQTKVCNFYMSTQWSMESTFVKLLLIVWNDITNLCVALSLHTSRNHLSRGGSPSLMAIKVPAETWYIAMDLCD